MSEVSGGIVDLNVIRGDVIAGGPHVTCLGIPGPSGDGGSHAYLSVVQHILNRHVPCVRLPAWCFRGLGDE